MFGYLTSAAKIGYNYVADGAKYVKKGFDEYVRPSGKSSDHVAEAGKHLQNLVVEETKAGGWTAYAGACFLKLTGFVVAGVLMTEYFVKTLVEYTFKAAWANKAIEIGLPMTFGHNKFIEETSKKALSLITDLAVWAIKHPIDLTLFGGGAGFVAGHESAWNTGKGLFFAVKSFVKGVKEGIQFANEATKAAGLLIIETLEAVAKVIFGGDPIKDAKEGLGKMIEEGQKLLTNGVVQIGEDIKDLTNQVEEKAGNAIKQEFKPEITDIKDLLKDHQVPVNGQVDEEGFEIVIN